MNGNAHITQAVTVRNGVIPWFLSPRLLLERPLREAACLRGGRNRGPRQCRLPCRGVDADTPCTAAAAGRCLSGAAGAIGTVGCIACATVATAIGCARAAVCSDWVAAGGGQRIGIVPVVPVGITGRGLEIHSKGGAHGSGCSASRRCKVGQAYGTQTPWFV